MADGESVPHTHTHTRTHAHTHARMHTHPHTHTHTQSNWDQVVDSFDDMNLREDLLRGIYAYG